MPINYGGPAKGQHAYAQARIDTDQFIEALKHYASREDIKSLFSVSDSTLDSFVACNWPDKTFKMVRDHYWRTTDHALRKKQIEIATKGKGNVEMLKHLGKHYLGQHDKIEQLGAPLINVTNITLGELRKVLEHDPFVMDETCIKELAHYEPQETNDTTVSDATKDTDQ